MVGNETDAQRLAKWFYKNNPNGITWNAKPAGRTPAGFKRLGMGYHRVAYLHKASDVVYKIDKSLDSWGSMNNSGEVDNYPILVEKLRKKGFTKVRVPETSGHEFMLDAVKVMVCAMQYVVGQLGNDSPNSYGSVAHNEYRSCGVSDQHGGNYIVDDEDNIWVIDLGGYV